VAEAFSLQIQLINAGAETSEVVRHCSTLVQGAFSARAVTFYTRLADRWFAGPPGTSGADRPSPQLEVTWDPEVIAALTRHETYLIATGDREPRDPGGRTTTRAPIGAVAPIRALGSLVGAVELDLQQPAPISREDCDLLLAAADYLGLALENGILKQRLADAARASERDRLAGELHDAVNQTLFAAGLLADLAPNAWGRDPTRALEMVNEVRQLTRTAQAEMRTLLLELRPTRLVQGRLDALLEELVQPFEARMAVTVERDLHPPGDLPPDAQVAFYRTAQEALNNISKHAHPSTVKLTLEQTQTGVELRIEDDGSGFDPDAVGPTHLGLGIMRDRAEGIGARLLVNSAPGQGTSISLLWDRGTPPV
jgi:signal transduction histidine kinase